MPNYTYLCETCCKKFEIFTSIKEYNPRPKCVFCKSKKTNRSYSDDLTRSSAFVRKSDDELKTVGDLANRNRDKMSNDQKIELYQKHNNYKENSSQKPLPQGMSRIKSSKTKNRWY